MLIICSVCKSEYRLTSHISDTPESDTEYCKVCGTNLISWKNSRVTYSSKLKIRRKWHLLGEKYGNKSNR